MIDGIVTWQGEEIFRTDQNGTVVMTTDITRERLAEIITELLETTNTLSHSLTDALML
jgi:hypothetical protein